MSGGAGPGEGPQLSSQEVLSFLKGVEPFRRLDQDLLRRLASQCAVENHPKGAMILEGGRSPVPELRVVYQGNTNVFLEDADGGVPWQEQRGQGKCLGVLAMFRGGLSTLSVEALEDTVCLLIDREVFLDLTERSAPFAQFFLKFLSEDYVGKAFSELSRPQPKGPAEGSLYLFSAKVGEVVRREPVTIAATASVRHAAQTMIEAKVGSLLVTDGGGKVVGILTDRDLRRVVASGADMGAPAEGFMASPVHSVSAHTTCFDAMIKMLRMRVHHMAVERGGRIVGLLSGHDLMVVQGTSPLYLLREITESKTLTDLRPMARRTQRVVRSMIYEGAKAGNITRMITMLNDALLERLLSLLSDKLGPPPVEWCWLLMGSEGRREQTFHTDQDNGLIYSDPESEAQAAECREYFTALAGEAIEELVAMGIPRCKGGVMAVNDKWRQPYTVWRGYFDRWLSVPEPREVLNATIFFDFRAGYGNLELGQMLREHLTSHARGQDVFFHHLARDCMATPAALTLFRNLATERSGPHKNKFDLKTLGITPLVDFARLMSLRAGVAETNTQLRLQGVRDAGEMSEELHIKASQAFEFLMQVRLMHQDHQHSQGQEPDNYLDPDDLSELERHALRDALSVAGEIKSFIKDYFRLNV